MPDNNPQNEVKIFDPDRSLHAKAGYANLDQAFSPQTVAKAETVIAQSVDQFMEEGLRRVQEIEKDFATLQKSPAAAFRLIPLMIDSAFSVKTKLGMGGYDLAAELAKSLQLHCEQVKGKVPTEKNMDIFQWHIASLKQLLQNKVKGTGGAAGEAILAEVKRLLPADFD